MAKLVSKTYGEALFELAKERNTVDDMMEEVLGVQKAFQENPDLMKLLNHPKISREEKIAVIEKIFKDRVSDDMTGFLILLVEKGRYHEMDAVFEYFISKVKEFKNIGVAYVTSAVSLTEKQKQDVLNRLLQTTKYTKFEMHYKSDKELIGGMVLRIGDRVVDSSVRSKIAAMAKELSQGAAR